MTFKTKNEGVCVYIVSWFVYTWFSFSDMLPISSSTSCSLLMLGRPGLPVVSNIMFYGLTQHSKALKDTVAWATEKASVSFLQATTKQKARLSYQQQSLTSTRLWLSTVVEAWKMHLLYVHVTNRLIDFVFSSLIMIPCFRLSCLLISFLAYVNHLCIMMYCKSLT